MKTVLHGARLVAAAEIHTPIGPMTALATSQGLAALWFDARERYAADIGDLPDDPDHPAIAAARRWLDVYWSGGDASGIDVPLDLRGTAFQRAVWAQLQRIPRGRTRTYGEVAAAVGGGEGGDTCKGEGGEETQRGFHESGNVDGLGPSCQGEIAA